MDATFFSIYIPEQTQTNKAFLSLSICKNIMFILVLFIIFFSIAFCKTM